MATTIQLAFQELRQNLEITGLQKTTVATRQSNVRKAIEDDLTVNESFLTGSYSKHTMIAPLKEADVDIFVVLHSDYYHRYNGQNGGQGGLIDLVKRTLRKTYTKTPEISRNGQAVTITFADFIVDAVPCFSRQGGGYLIPDSHSQTWIETDPTVHVNLMTEQNTSHNGDLVPLVKMIKGWNRNIGQAFISFYLELIAIDIFRGVTITNVPSGMRYFFDKGREKIKKKAIDPAGFGHQINGLDNVSTVALAIKKFETAYNRAVAAEQSDNNLNVYSVVEGWRKIFGDYFPAYG